MKLNLGLLIGMSVFISTTLSYADYPELRMEIPVEKVFAPYKGFDDNDNVEVVVYGRLPNACYRLADSFAQHLDDGVTIALFQYVTRLDEGICANHEELPPHMTMTIPFTKTIGIGRLNPTNYRLRYLTTSHKYGYRRINIAPALFPTVDSLPYAAVSNAMVPDVINGINEIKVTLTGVLNSTCTSLDQAVQIQRQKNVFVLLPTIKVHTDRECAQVLVPFTHELNLGRAVPGQYLIHIRAMNGSSVNRVITVSK